MRFFVLFFLYPPNILVGFGGPIDEFIFEASIGGADENDLEAVEGLGATGRVGFLEFVDAIELLAAFIDEFLNIREFLDIVEFIEGFAAFIDEFLDTVEFIDAPVLSVVVSPNPANFFKKSILL